MARPRFKKLKPEKQERILMAAAAEFASKGFDGASFNQIIEAAEISKGAAYYYFDDKDDLYTTVIEHAWRKIAEFAGDYNLDGTTREDFWSHIEDYSRESLRRAQEHPMLTKLGRVVLAYAKANPDGKGGRLINSAAKNMTREWLQHGQTVGAVRTDLDMPLMVEIIMGLGYATDAWVLEHLDEMDEDDIDHYAVQLTDIYRRVFQPGPNDEGIK